MPGSATFAGSLLTAIKGRKFSSIAKLFPAPVEFEGWTPTGHWVAQDGSTIAKIVEVWFTPGGTGTTVVWSNETTSKGVTVLEYEVTWKTQPEDQPRALRQAWLLQMKGDKVVSARVYCAGPHTEFPDVDLDKQRRSKGLGAPKPPNSPRVVAAKAS
jgi:hypothetical protein